MNFLENNLVSSKLCFRRHHPCRQINSLYYDTINLDSYQESIEGTSFRTKRRIRWYGSEENKVPATLEFKKKLSYKSYKILWRNIFTISRNRRCWDEFVVSQGKQDSTRKLLSNVFPTSLISYFRSYFISFDGKIRITLDKDLKFYDQRLSSFPNNKFYRSNSQIIVLEIKAEEKNELHLNKFLKTFPFAPSRFSKYCESMHFINKTTF